MHSTGQPVSQSVVGYAVQLSSFSHWHLIFYTLNVGISQCIMGVDLWGSEFCSGAEFVEVLQKKKCKETHTKKVIKMCSIPRPQATKKSILK